MNDKSKIELLFIAILDTISVFFLSMFQLCMLGFMGINIKNINSLGYTIIIIISLVITKIIDNIDEK